MHYHLEIILPPVENVQESVAQILKPFSEDGKDEDGRYNSHGFWDFYVIGGRWSGAKLEATFDSKKKDEFFAEIVKRKFTVSGVTAGKQKLQPASQRSEVDKLFNDFFPDSPIKVCPFFAHFNNQYSDSLGFPDVMMLGATPLSLNAERVIIASPSYEDKAKLEAGLMFERSYWNGVNHIKSEWDGNIFKAVQQRKAELEDAKPEYAALRIPTDEWLVVTVDYHS